MYTVTVTTGSTVSRATYPTIRAAMRAREEALRHSTSVSIFRATPREVLNARTS